MEVIGTKAQISDLLFVRKHVHARHELVGRGRDQRKVEFMLACDLEEITGNADSGDVDQASIEWISVELLDDLNGFPRRLMLLTSGDPSVCWGDQCRSY